MIIIVILSIVAIVGIVSYTDNLKNKRKIELEKMKYQKEILELEIEKQNSQIKLLEEENKKLDRIINGDWKDI